MAWREECHRYISENPGHVVTKFQFSSLFSKAWLKSMTMANIIGGFRVTGVYPINRDALSPPSLESKTLSKETGLPFIPLYSPATRATGSRCFSEDSPNKECDSFSREIGLDFDSFYSPVPQHEPREDGFTEREIALFETRYENGYDIMGDDRYRQWLSKTHPEEAVWMQPLKYGSTAVSHFLSCPSPPSRIPTTKPKSCGRVLTSAENIRILEEKQKIKMQKQKAKKEREEARRRKALMMSLPGLQSPSTAATRPRSSASSQRGGKSRVSSLSTTSKRVPPRSSVKSNRMGPHSADEPVAGSSDSSAEGECTQSTVEEQPRSIGTRSTALSQRGGKSRVPSHSTAAAPSKRVPSHSSEGECAERTMGEQPRCIGTLSSASSRRGRKSLSTTVTQSKRVPPQSSNRIHSASTKKGSDCSDGTCSHPRAVYWVQCGRSKCKLWYHCQCVGVLPQKAKLSDYKFYCCT